MVDSDGHVTVSELLHMCFYPRRAFVVIVLAIVDVFFGYFIK